MESLKVFGIALIQSLQSLSPTLDGVMGFFSFLGRVEFFLLLIPLIYWNVDSRLGFRLMLVLFFTDFLGSACKQLLRQPRPYWIGGVQSLSKETSYGFVSTHASNTLAVWGLLAIHFQRRWLWILSIFVVLMVGISRLYLGVHFPHDVLAGWLLGALVLFVFLRSEPRFQRWIQPKTMSFRIALGGLASLLIIATGKAILAVTSPLSDPAAFASFSVLARSPDEYITLGGALFGAVLGYEMMKHSARYKIGGTLIRQMARYVLGVAGVMAIYLGLDVLFAGLAPDDSLPGQALRYVRYAAVTWFATFGAVWMFLRLRLMEQEGLA